MSTRPLMIKDADDMLEFIKSRRSIRRYTNEPVPDELIIKMLEAARWAPTGEDQQPWRYIVIRDPKMRKRLSTWLGSVGGAVHASPGFIENLRLQIMGTSDPERRRKFATHLANLYARSEDGMLTMQLKAPVVIVCMCDLTKPDAMWDLCVSMENLLLEAHALGLGACWVNAAAFHRWELKWKEILKIPKGIAQYRILAYIGVGWPAESPKPRPRIQLEEMVYWEEFGKTERT